MNRRHLSPLLAAWLAFPAAWVSAPGRAQEKEGAGAFFDAIHEGHLEEVRRRLDEGVSPDARDREGTTALYLACDLGRPAIARLLVERGAEVDAVPRRKGGSRALQVAIYRGFDAYELEAREGYPELIRLLVEKGADVNAADVDGNTPLIAAAEKDDRATLALLLQRGAELGHVNENGWTALDRAVAYRRRTIAHELVRLGAPLDEEQRLLQRRHQFARRAGAWFPALLIGSFVLAALMARRRRSLPKRTEAPASGDDLPKLQPLRCGACGGSASLRPGVATCSHCHEPVPVPEDYTETLKLRERTFRLLEKAVRLWKRVRFVSMAPVRWALWIAAIAFTAYMWKGLFPLFVRDALYDLMSFSGTLVWALGVLAMAAVAIALAGYAIYLGEVRRAIPAPPEAGAHQGQAEVLSCGGCGGAVELAPHDLVGLCGYCGSETYRVALAREARTKAAGQKDEAALSLYQAMERVYELRENAALAIPAAILVIGFGLVVVLRVALFFV